MEKLKNSEDVMIGEHYWARLVKSSQSDVSDETEFEDLMPRARLPRTPAWAQATKVAEKDLVVTLPIRLGIVFNFSVFQHEVLQDPAEACKARMAFDASKLFLQERSSE